MGYHAQLHGEIRVPRPHICFYQEQSLCRLENDAKVKYIQWHRSRIPVAVPDHANCLLAAVCLLLSWATQRRVQNIIETMVWQVLLTCCSEEYLSTATSEVQAIPKLFNSLKLSRPVSKGLQDSQSVSDSEEL